MRGRMRIEEQRDRDRDKERGIVVLQSKKHSGMVAFSFFILCSLILLVQPSSSSTQQPPNLDPDNIYLLDPNANHVSIDVGSHVSVAIANVSDLNLVLNNGEKLQAWVDYEASSKVLEVRLSKWGEQKPSDPIVSHDIDFSKIWGKNPVIAALSSSNGAHSVQVVSVYSWRVSLKKVSNGLHSLPADPHSNNNNNKFEDEHKKSVCPLTVLAWVIFGTGCVALVTFVVLFMWVIFFQKGEEESLVKIPDHPSSDVRYERIDVAVDKNAHDDQS
ncbi:L-type lectin-domain containing receptor kinase S.4 [Glycine soja]|nr:L-type lectin-domain containing receptor kinase S.4 [Glycine soja]